MKHVKVSVIIPFYNNIEWLRDAVDSVLTQTFKDYEIILVNDGSNENLADFLLEYGDRLKYIYQENKGPAAARNNGIKHAIGEYIAFEDADDLWLPTKLEKQIAFMEQCGAVWSHTGFYYWYPQSDKKIIINNSDVYENIFKQRLIATKIATPSVIIKKSIIEKDKLYFPEETRNGEDDQLYTRISRYYNIALIQEPLVKVRMRGTNSYTKVVERFHLRQTNYLKWKSENIKMPFIGECIYFIYRVYASMFSINYKSNIKVNNIAKLFWTIPYSLERIYLKYLAIVQRKDKKYLKLYKEKNK